MDEINKAFEGKSEDLASREAALRAKAEALVKAEADDRALLAKFVEEARAKRDAELREEAEDLVAAEDNIGPLTAQGFPKKFYRLRVAPGPNPHDLSYVTVSINGYAFKIRRGELVIVPSVVVNVLEDAVEEVTIQSEGGLVTRPNIRFPYSILGEATEAEYLAFASAARAAQHQPVAT